MAITPYEQPSVFSPSGSASSVARVRSTGGGPATPDSASPAANVSIGLSLDDVRAQVKRLEDEHRAKGIPLSGRIVHVCHYLPVTCTLAARAQPSTTVGVPTPPLTPPVRPTDVAPAPEDVPVIVAPQAQVTPAPAHAHVEQQNTGKWVLNPRWGHSAMFSGIHSLSETHQQVVIGWTGDLGGDIHAVGHLANEGDKEAARARVPLSEINDVERTELERVLGEGVGIGEFGEGEGRNAHLVPVWLEDKLAHAHYDGYCKTTLWPLFHYLLWQDVTADVSASTSDDWDAYRAVNAAFAERVAEVLQPGDLVWVHDYHLLLVPGFLKEMLAAETPEGSAQPREAIVGMFVHTPFPSSEVFRCLPRRKEILDGMLGANLVCFQTYSYARHFTSSCIRVCGYETASSSLPSRGVGGVAGIDVQGHVTAVAYCPVGVDAERVTRDVTRPGIQPKLEALRSLYEGKKIIVARDKLDVVKGVVQKLRAFERLLQDYPDWVGNVVLIQVTSPALSDSPRLERQVSELVAHINGEFGALDFVPVHHYHQTIKKDEFYALLSVADLAVITPLRDGMNTTSMEFVIAQERSNKAPLVLSEFMGISSTMEDALQVNPWDLGGMAAAINHGLLMPESERLARHAKLYKVVTTHTSHTWAAVLARMLLAQISTEHTAHSTPYLNREQLRSVYHSAKRRLFLFDYDGTLTPIVKTPSAAVPSKETLEALEKLSADPRNLVFIISGRDGEFLEHHLGYLRSIGMSAEHGGFMRQPGEKGWTNLTESLDMSWMSEVEEIFKYYTERTTGSHIEIKKSSITWHYRASDPEWGLFQCRQCQDLLENNLASKRPIEVLVGKKNLEVRPLAVNKGEIVKRILYENPDAEFVFCAGDDKTDEDMFRALAPFTHTGASQVMEAPIAVNLFNKSGNETPPVELSVLPEGVFSTAVGSGSKKTLASWHVTSPQEVVEHMLDLVNNLDGPHQEGEGAKSNL